MSSQKYRADAHIMKRRAQEEANAWMTSQINREQKLKHTADWENKTNAIMKKNTVSNRISQLEQEGQKQLEERRFRLAELLRSEEEMYQAEYRDKEETAEQIREKMFERVIELKDSRERDRQEAVRAALDKQFKDRTDDLRTQDSKTFALQCQLEREMQVEEKKQRETLKKREESLYDELWKRDMRRKELREKQEQEEKKAKLGQTLTYLENQRQTRVTGVDRARLEKRQENEELKEAWRQQAEREAALEREKLLLRKQRDTELLLHNQTELTLKEQQRQREREMDKKMVEDTMEREQALAAIEAEKREKRRQDGIKLQNILMEKRQKNEMNEADLEGRIKQESDKQWDRREQKWRQEADARVNLMKDVYNNRADEIVKKRNDKEQARTLQLQEKERLEAEIAHMNKMTEIEKEQKALEAKRHQRDILFQVEEKKLKKQKDLQDEIYMKKAAELAEKQYKNAIEVEKRKGQAALEELRKKRPY
eukprot:CAMPEP_0114996542 /NCGR_PEP_ID=MMETSP0216-20121206/14377_1 /TAXON_ID=223996 /ORGANISM="Protocruzia adherens, Strain Boccale" /LENGTH=482 /DNA_ID=CAMNT_0002360775 /DNA_START=189 /DNA_END=1637 /DNA_ORIENTATION=+